MTFSDKIDMLTGIFENYLKKSKILKDTIDEEAFLRNAVLATLKSIDVILYDRITRIPGYKYSRINKKEIELTSDDKFQYNGIVSKISYSINIAIYTDTIQIIISTRKNKQVKNVNTYNITDWKEIHYDKYCSSKR